MLPNLRETINSLLGKPNRLFPNNKKAIGFRWFGLRQPDYTARCSCGNTEGTTDSITCFRCFNTGYVFTDYLVKGYFWLGVLGVEYSTSPGLIATQQKNLVIEHDRPINKFDYILELNQDPVTNKVTQPFQIMKYLRVQDSLAVRGDDSRVEFWRCNVEERNIKPGVGDAYGTGFKYQGNRSNIEPE